MILLTTNKKLEKESGYTIMGLNLAPHNVSGYNVCPHAGACAEVCIGEHSGFMQMPSVRKSQIRKTKLFFEDRPRFLKELHQDLTKLSLKDNPACRLNVDSDIPWESIDKTLFDYPITFYDYTKNPRRIQKYIEDKLPNNYYLTYSYSEKSDKTQVNKFLAAGANINVVFSIQYVSKSLLPLPTKLKINTKEWEVVDGDLHDLRIPSIDGIGVVTGVRAKIRKDLIDTYVQKGFFVKGNKI